LVRHSSCLQALADLESFSKICLTLFLLDIPLLFSSGLTVFNTPPKVTSNNQSTISVSNDSGATTTGAASQSTEKIFTPAQLAQYDGTNGQPAYVAVDGVVYDLKLGFYKWQPHGFSAGQDQSAAFHSQHLTVS